MRPALASTLAVIAGFATTAITSTVADAVMHATGAFADSPDAMTASQFGIASAYRALFTVLGGYITARLAPSRPMRHAGILAAIGLLAGIAGVVGYYMAGNGRLGPAWYALSIPLQAIPCVTLGGWLATRLAEARR